MTAPYWEGQSWPEELARETDYLSTAWERDWGVLLRGVSERCGISLTEATMFYIARRIATWTQENLKAQQASIEIQRQHNAYIQHWAPIMEHALKEINDLKKGDGWKGEEPPV